MQAGKAKGRLNIVKFTYLMLALAALGVGSAYGYHLFTLYRDAQQFQPQLQADRLIRDLRRYEKQNQHFPSTFHEINQQIWHTQPAPDYGREGRQARTKNYYYVYHRIAADKCVLWALPVGPHRALAASYFFVIAPNWLKGWKGAALSDEQMGKLSAVPTPDELAQWRIYELPAKAKAERMRN